jgi:hypothetical protein
MIELETSVKQDDTTRTRILKPGYLNLSNNSFGPRSRYRKKLPAAAPNQIAGNQKISLGMHK